MSDLNDLTKPDLQSSYANSDVPDTLLGHIKRLWTGDYTGMSNLVPNMLRWAITGTTTLSARLYRRNVANADVEVTVLPGVSIGGNAATATSLSSPLDFSGISSALAGMTPLAVGSLAILAGNDSVAGTTRSGSSLQITGAISNFSANYDAAGIKSINIDCRYNYGQSPPGTWKCLSDFASIRYQPSGVMGAAGLWIRIA
jgi:hypothetical protein